MEEQEITEITPEFLMACAIHPTCWQTWVLEELLDAIVTNIEPTTPFSISCTPDGVWIVANKQYEVLLCTAPVVILPSETKPNEETAANNSTFFKALSECLTPDEPPPKRYA